MKKTKTLSIYKMDLNAFHEALKSKYFKDKFVGSISLDGPVTFPFGEQRVMNITIPVLGVRDKKGYIIPCRFVYEIVGPSIFMERVYKEVSELYRNGEFSKQFEVTQC